MPPSNPPSWEATGSSPTGVAAVLRPCTRGDFGAGKLNGAARPGTCSDREPVRGAKGRPIFGGVGIRGGATYADPPPAIQATSRRATYATSA